MRSSKSAVGGAARKLRKSGLVHWLLEALWPRRCPACRLPTPSRGVDWCESCATALARSPGQPYCPRCGADASPLVVRAEGCPNCRGQAVRYSQLVRVGGYDGPLREAIIRFKYQGQAKLDRTLAKLLLAGLYGTDWFEQVELIVTVPTHWRRRMQRGYDQVELLARQLASLSGKRHAAGLRAARAVRPQVGLSSLQRHQNVRGAFRAAGWIGGYDGVVCLVDDVTTTGATLREAAQTLARAGVGRTYTAVLAKAMI